MMFARSILLSCLFIPTLATAATSDADWYSGIQFGQGHYSNLGEYSAERIENDRWAAGAYIGYYFNDYVSMEFGYQYLGNASATYTDGLINGDFQQLHLDARLGWPIAQFYPYVKVGGAAWDGNSEGLRVGDEQGFSPVVGGGLEYRMENDFSIRVEYQYTDELGDDTIGYADHHLTSVGFVWGF